MASAVESGLCKFGVLPIENSSNGSVRAVYELLQDHRLSVVRSTRLCIRHELLALPGRIAVDAEMRSAQEVSGIVRREVCSVLEGLTDYQYDPKAYAAMVRERRGWQVEEGDGED